MRVQSEYNKEEKMKLNWRLILALILNFAILGVLIFSVGRVFASDTVFTKIYLKSGETVHEIGRSDRIEGSNEGTFTLIFPTQDMEGITIDAGTFYVCSVACSSETCCSEMVCSDVSCDHCPQITTTTTIEYNPDDPVKFRWSYDGYETTDSCDDPTINWPPFVVHVEAPPHTPGCMRRVQ